MSIEDQYRQMKEREKERRRFLFAVIGILAITSILAFVSGFYNVDSMSPNDKKDLAKSIASIVFPMSAILTFVLTQTVVLRGKLEHSKFDRTSQLTACTRLCHTSISTVMLCAVTGALSIYAFKSANDVLLSGSLYFLSLIFALLIFNVLYFYYTYAAK